MRELGPILSVCSGLRSAFDTRSPAKVQFPAPNGENRGTAGEGSQFKSAYVNLKAKDSPSVEYTINGTQRDVVYFADQLDDCVCARIRRVKRDFATVSPFNFGTTHN
jgi:hypothetical protein